MKKSIYHPFDVACLFVIVAGVALFCVLTGATEAKQSPNDTVPISAVGNAVEASYADDLDEATMIPRLVGYGCKGASGPLFANEEDHFPAPCEAVEAWR